MSRYFIFFILFVIGFTSLERFCHRQTHGFRPYKILPSSSSSEWSLPTPPDQEKQSLQKILSQPFYFLNSGGESYAFVSKDGTHVIKFFKHHHMRSKSWFDPLLPFSFRTKLQKKRKEKLQTLFNSCKLAFEQFRDGTGLIYLHFCSTDIFSSKIKLYDAIGAVHYLDLNKLDFALQKKASMAYPTITSLVEAREIDAAKERLSSLVDLIVHRCQAGLADHDARKRNFGFIKDQAIEIDLGSFTANDSLKSPEATKKVLLMETLRLRRWVKKYHPELSEFLEEKIQTHLSQNKPLATISPRGIYE